MESIMFLKDVFVSKNSGPFISCRRSGLKGFTLIELLIVIIILGILSSIAIGFFQFYTNKAYKIIMLHDINEFVKAEEGYYTENKRYLGATGDFIENGNPPVGALTAAGFIFSPSEGVKIEIVSGDGANPYDPGSPFKAQASHKKSKSTCMYDFSTNQTFEKD
jgi:prepilin-type N-terminal cleavage/methylation domain-containing protein